MKKFFLIGGAFVIIIIIVLVFGLSNLGPIIKKAVNTYGPQITKTDVSLDDVDISLFTAEAKLKDLLLGNPKGFKSAQAMKVKSIRVKIDKKSLTKDTIIIDSIEVIAPDITYEKISGTDNFRTILDNVNKSTGADKAKKEKSEGQKEGEDKKEGEGKKLLIRNFIVKDGKVNFSTSLLGNRTISANLPDIHLKNIGEKKGGATPAEAVKEIFKSLYAKITSPAVTDVFKNGLKNLTGGAKAAVDKAKELGGSAGEGVKAASDKLKGMFNK